MATRRPKVPKVAPARPVPKDSDGGDVILADFGAGKDKEAPPAQGNSGGVAAGIATLAARP